MVIIPTALCVPFEITTMSLEGINMFTMEMDYLGVKQFIFNLSADIAKQYCCRVCLITILKVRLPYKFEKELCINQANNEVHKLLSWQHNRFIIFSAKETMHLLKVLPLFY